MEEKGQKCPCCDPTATTGTQDFASTSGQGWDFDKVTKVYNHSKSCNCCNEKLGDFLKDVSSQLGVKMPDFKDDTENHGQEGACNCVWDEKDPSVKTAACKIEELKFKARVKDTLIQALADELKSDKNFDPTLLNEKSPSDPPDFDLRTLSRYLNQ